MAHTAKHNATIAKKAAAAKKKTAQKKIDNLKKAMGGKVDISKLGKKQLNSWNKSIADRKSESNTIRTANIVISNAKKAENIVKRYEDDPAEQMRRLQIERNKQMEERGKQLIDPSLKGKQFEKGGAFDYGLSAQAYGDAMRAITGRQMGERTAYTGPGVRVRIDDQGNVVTQDGRVQYDIDPNAYAKRFRPQYQPTQEQLDYFKNIFGEGYNVSPGMITPWQQVNLQHMLQYPGLLGKDDISDLTIAEQENLGIFGEGIKEGRVPAAWREAWRTEQWGDTFNETTGRWERTTDPEKRAAAVADQLERYKMGAFNPTTGKLYLDAQGNVVGPKASWGPGTGILHPDDVYIDNPPVDPLSGPRGGPRGGGAYTRPTPKDWSSLRYTYAGSPESELGQVTQTPASRAMFGKQGRALQPWTGGQGVPAGLLNYQAPRGVGFDVTYSGGNPNLFDFNNNNQNNQNNNGTTYGTDGKYDNYHDWYMATDNPFGHYWALDNANANSPWTWNKGTGNWDFDATINPLVQSKTGDTLTNIEE